MHERVTLMPPDTRDPIARGISSGFPIDLVADSAARLRVLAALYASVFFMAGVFPALLFLSCLAKAPASRPPSARELSHRLSEVDATSAWTQERAREWWMMHVPVVTTRSDPDGIDV
jgi:hypothetical protein